MTKNLGAGSKAITPEMTVLDIIAQHRPTEAVFKKYDQKAGVCICCEALFDRLGEVAQKYHIDLEQLMNELETAGET